MRPTGIAFSIFAALVIVLSGCEAPPPGFQSVEWNKKLPVVVEEMAADHRIKIQVAEAAPASGGDFFEFDEACQTDDLLTLTIWRDGAEVHSETFCSAYQLAMVRLYQDVKGEPFLFLGSAHGRGTGITSRHVRLLEIGTEVDEQGGFYAGRRVGEDTYLSYEYRVTKPPKGGLVVDTRATYSRSDKVLLGIPSDACCVEDLKATEQFRLGQARREAASRAQ